MNDVRDYGQLLEELALARERVADLENELAATRAILLTAIEQAPVGFVIADFPDMVVRIASLEALGIMGKDSSPTRDVSIEDHLKDWQLLRTDGTPYRLRERPLEQAILEGKACDNVECIVRRKNGDQCWVAINAAPVKDDNGEIIAGVMVLRDITAVKALEEERARTLSFFAHDMKSPLFGAASFLDRILCGKAGETGPKVEEYLRITQGLVNRVMVLAMDFLDVARLGKSGVCLPMESIEICSLLSGIVEEYKERARKMELSLLVCIDNPLPRVIADPHRLGRVIANLLDNAIKFTRSGAVEIRAWPDLPDRVSLEILDEGPGLSEKDLKNLFRPFYRGNAGRGIEGTGLGLAAVRAIVQAHGGFVTGENRPHGGARFVVTLPVACDNNFV
jgi:signal transduction histidine kinase